MSTDTVVIARQFRGPPESGNGGYVCGVVAARIAGPARVRLHSPPPLERPLTISTSGTAHVQLLDGDRVIAEGISAAAPDEVPAPVSYAAASAAAERCRWLAGHPFPGCFVCGPDRHAGDGLCIHPGAVPGRDIVAAPWVPDASMCDTEGRVVPEIVWSALDCPSWFGLLEFESGTTVGLLGQLSASIVRPPAAGERCVVIGWASGRSGRKLAAGAALYSSTGELLGSSAAIWIEPAA